MLLGCRPVRWPLGRRWLVIDRCDRVRKLACGEAVGIRKREEAATADAVRYRGDLMLRLLLADEMQWLLLHLLENIDITVIVFLVTSIAFEMVGEVLRLAVLRICWSMRTRSYLVRRSIFAFLLHLVERKGLVVQSQVIIPVLDYLHWFVGSRCASCPILWIPFDSSGYGRRQGSRVSWWLGTCHRRL